MKLLHLLGSADPECGGPVENVRQMSAIYKARGIDVDIVSLDPPHAAFLKTSPIPIRTAGKIYGGNYRYSPHLVSWLKRNHRNYDCVIVNGIWQFHSYACWLALHKTDTPYIVFTHGMLDPWFRDKYPLKHLKKSLYWPWAEYRVLRDAKRVLFTSEEEQIQAAKSFQPYEVNSFVVGYGTRVPAFNLDELRGRFFDQYPHLRGKRIAVFIGRIHPKKGCDLLIQAFQRTLAQSPEWHLLMVGPDQIGWQKELQRISAAVGIEGRITWPGMLRDDRKWSAIAAAEVFVLPSHQENFGIVVAESLACGVPVLISTKVNIWREIENDGAGFVEEDSLAGTVRLLDRWVQLDNPARDAIKNKTRQCFDAHFDLDRNAARFIEMIRSIARKPPQSGP